MTRDEILAMDPGKMLNAAVDMNRNGHFDNIEAFRQFLEGRGIYFPSHLNRIPRVSSNMEAAWELVEILRETRIDGKEYAVGLWVQHDGKCEVEIMLDEDSVAWVGGKHATDTMPEAICKAYLLVMGVEGGFAG